MAVNLLPGIVEGPPGGTVNCLGGFFFSYIPRLPPCNYLRGPESEHHHFKRAELQCMLPADSWPGSEVCCFNLSSKILGKWKPCGEASSPAVGEGQMLGQFFLEQGVGQPWY